METLFSSRKFTERIDSLSSSLNNNINRLPKSDFEDSTIDELVEKFNTKYKIEVPQLLEDKIYQKKPKDTQIEIRGFQGRRNVVEGTIYTFMIPFEGDSSMFTILPSSFMSVLPRAYVGNNELKIQYEIPISSNSSLIKTDFDKNLDIIKKYLGFLNQDINLFNNKLESTLKTKLEMRKNKLDKDDEITSGFGFPIK